ncbi:PREDICTED: interferon-induced transmembrane protein 10-like isoform X3 [Ficedula albicollis]|uniref:interferon-induced transmembrane protein 10-like isoform X3 n=1 Tax=Ficedula albicollis TaxID=59894 RepID=UPI0003593097|nr:PREDICTED: interferon-induced transmembrane protein 10-like isoform X3 [Ficedula albicollis]
MEARKEAGNEGARKEAGRDARRGMEQAAGTAVRGFSRRGGGVSSCPSRGVRRGGPFPLRPRSSGNETAAAAPALPCASPSGAPRVPQVPPPSRSMQQPLPPYEVLPAGVSMEELPRSTTVLLDEPPRPPRDHLVWSLCTTLYGNFCCLGLLAFVFSVKSRDRKVLGDYSGALSYASTAKWLNITALVIHIIVVVIVIVIIALAVSGALTHMGPPPSYNQNPFSFSGNT